jgi:hypothetical protein
MNKGKSLITCSSCHELYDGNQWNNCPKCGKEKIKPPQPNRDPLIMAARKAYKSTRTYEVRQLLAEEARWRKKATIARNKLESVRLKLRWKAEELAAAIDGIKVEVKL